MNLFFHYYSEKEDSIFGINFTIINFGFSSVNILQCL